MRVEFLPAAYEEHLAAAEFHERRRLGLGARFLSEVFDTVWRIRDDSESCTLEQESVPGEELRYVRLKSFPCRLVFLILGPDLAMIVAVVHDAQRPGFWRERL